jgi:hypothetical protein
MLITSIWCLAFQAAVKLTTIILASVKMFQISSQTNSWFNDICATVFSPTIILVTVTECFKFPVRLTVGAITFVLLSLVQPLVSVADCFKFPVRLTVGTMTFVLLSLVQPSY